MEAIYITFLIYAKDIYGEKNERNRFFNSCHSLLDIAWPLLLRSWSRLQTEYYPHPQEKNCKNTTFEYVIHNDILVSQMCKQQNFHLSLLTMEQQYIVSKARYLSYFTGYWVKYNWLSFLFVCFIFRLRAGGGAAPSLNTRYKPGRKTPMHLSSDSEEDLSFTWCTSSIILDVGWKLWLGIIVGCLQVDFSDSVASQKKAYGCCQTIKFVQAWLLKSWNGQPRVFYQMWSRVLAEQALLYKDGEWVFNDVCVTQQNLCQFSLVHIFHGWSFFLN